MQTLPHGQPFYISEILARGSSMDGTSVRVLGKLVEYDIPNNKAIIEFNECILNIDTNNLTQICFNIGSLYQLIGEINLFNEQVILKVRVIRCVDGLDIALYDETLKILRKFQEDRGT